MTYQPETETFDAATLARTMLAETREELAKADQKASLLLAALGVALAAVAGAVGSNTVRPYGYGPLGQMLFWAGCAVSVVSVFLFGSTVRPRTGRGSAPGGIHYFGDLADGALTVDQIRAELGRTDPVGRDIAQLRSLARIVSTKYRHIGHGMTTGAAGVALLVAGILVGAGA